MQWRDLLQEPGQPVLLPLLPATDDLSAALTEALYDLIINDLALYLAARQAISGCQSLGGAAFQLERLWGEPQERPGVARTGAEQIRAAVLLGGWRLVRWHQLAAVIGGDLLPAGALAGVSAGDQKQPGAAGGAGRCTAGRGAGRGDLERAGSTTCDRRSGAGSCHNSSLRERGSTGLALWRPPPGTCVREHTQVCRRSGTILWYRRSAK